jgi:hypothetical protein
MLEIINIFRNSHLGYKCFPTSIVNWADKYLTDKFLPLGLWHIFCSFILIAIIAILIKTEKYKSLFEWLKKNLGKSSAIIWVLGFLLYMVGMYRQELNALAVVPRAIVASFKMFVVANEQARVSSILQEDAIYMTLFALVHFAAALISFLFIFKMVGYKMHCAIKMKWHNYRLANGKNVHLFWGVNEASLLLAENIYNKNKEDKKDETIIFIDVDKECNNDCQKKPSISFLTNTITISDSEMSRLDKIGALVDHCYNGPASVDVTNNSDIKDIFDTLRLNTVSKILQQSDNLNIYLLSDDEADNISAALNLQKDRNLTNLKKLPTIFVHARRDAYNEVFAHYSQYASDSKKMKIKVVDSAYLSIQSLKQDDNALPVNCVKHNTQTGTVDSPFTAMVVGFGATGQEAFKFLYEFASFIDSNKKKTPFKCYAFDEKMDRIEGLIRAKMPAITEDELTLIKTSVDTDIFWGRVKLLINELNYIIVALNNDTLGMSLAVNLFKYGLRYRDANLPQLKIMLRCYDRSNESRMKEVEKQLNVSARGLNVEIKLFSTSKELFTYNNVICNNVYDEAKEYHYVYENLLLPTEKQWKLTSEDQWKDSFVETKVNGKTTSKIDIEMEKHSISRFHAIQEINRKISQNFSNSLHGRTKMILMGFKEKSLTDRLKLFNSYTRTPHTVTYHCNEEDANLLYNIALVEHERWIASHKLMGYTFSSTTDYVKKHHKCMCDFDQLDVETQSYDCNVVDTTIKLAYNEATKKVKK